MEHVLLPQGAKLTESDLVPYLAREVYDGGPLLTFPERAPLCGNLRFPKSLKNVPTRSLTPD